MFELNFTFETIEELVYFIDNKFVLENQKIKKIDDKRGKSTKKFHELAKKYKTEHPNKTYRECLKDLSLERKSRSDLNNSEINNSEINNSEINNLLKD
jgi:hypothetical protein